MASPFSHLLLTGVTFIMTRFEGFVSGASNLLRISGFYVFRADTIIAISKMNSSDLLIRREGQKLISRATDIAKKTLVGCTIFSV